MPEALTAAEFDRLLAACPLPSRPPASPRLAVAVSGGSDSLALLLLLAQWRETLRPKAEIFVLTVDHRLRAEAAEEAAYVGRIARRAGLPHIILRWREARAGAGLPARARAARYGLMIGWCRRNRTPALMLGHQLEDQAAVFLFRLSRGSRIAGLAAMRPAAEREGIVLLRPLLSVPRARLRASLTAAGWNWRNDPSNDNPVYTRTRAGYALDFLARAGLPPHRLAAAAAGAASIRAASIGAASISQNRQEPKHL